MRRRQLERLVHLLGPGDLTIKRLRRGLDQVNKSLLILRVDQRLLQKQLRALRRTAIRRKR